MNITDDYLEKPVSLDPFIRREIKGILIKTPTEDKRVEIGEYSLARFAKDGENIRYHTIQEGEICTIHSSKEVDPWAPEGLLIKTFGQIKCGRHIQEKGLVEEVSKVLKEKGLK